MVIEDIIKGFKHLKKRTDIKMVEPIYTNFMNDYFKKHPPQNIKDLKTYYDQMDAMFYHHVINNY